MLAVDGLRQLNGWWPDVAGVAVEGIINLDAGLNCRYFRGQRFGKASRRNCRSSWMTELARRLDIPMISEAAATPIAIIAKVSASMVGMVLTTYKLSIAILRFFFSLPCLT